MVFGEHGQDSRRRKRRRRTGSAFLIKHKKVRVLGEDLLIEGEVERNVYGIIEEKGTISKIMKNASQAVLTIKAQKIMEDIHKGDSIAVNGSVLRLQHFLKMNFRQM